MEVFGADFHVVSLPVVLYYPIFVVPLFQLVDLRVVSLDSFPGHSQVMRVVYVGAVVPREVPIGDIGFTLMAVLSRLDSSSSLLSLISTEFDVLSEIIRLEFMWARLALAHLVSPSRIWSGSRCGTYSFPVAIISSFRGRKGLWHRYLSLKLINYKWISLLN
jgi:hypothetical protein